VRPNRRSWHDIAPRAPPTKQIQVASAGDVADEFLIGGAELIQRQMTISPSAFFLSFTCRRDRDTNSATIENLPRHTVQTRARWVQFGGGLSVAGVPFSPVALVSPPRLSWAFRWLLHAPEAGLSRFPIARTPLRRTSQVHPLAALGRFAGSQTVGRFARTLCRHLERLLFGIGPPVPRQTQSFSISPMIGRIPLIEFREVRST